MFTNEVQIDLKATFTVRHRLNAHGNIKLFGDFFDQCQDFALTRMKHPSIHLVRLIRQHEMHHQATRARA